MIEHVTNAEADDERSLTLTFVSRYDQTSQDVDLHLPRRSDISPLPLVIAPHPIGWTTEQDFRGGIPELKRASHPGWAGLATQYSVAIAQPHGHGRVDRLASCAYEGQIEDFASLPDIIEDQDIRLDRSRLYLCGLSMGGLESLVALGRYPDLFAAGFVFNPIVDLAAWHADLVRSPSPDIHRFRTWERVENEVGGPPEHSPDEYAKRSGSTYAHNLVGKPIMIYWSRFDPVVPRQASTHSLWLYQRVKALSESTPISQYEHSESHGVPIEAADADSCWKLHEYSDYALALQWLLQHRA